MDSLLATIPSRSFLPSPDGLLDAWVALRPRDYWRHQRHTLGHRSNGRSVALGSWQSQTDGDDGEGRARCTDDDDSHLRAA